MSRAAGTDQIIFVATLKIRLKSRKMAPSSQIWLHVCRLRDESVAQEYDSDVPEKLWTDFKTHILKASESCL